jgi:hypothetical protein
LETAGFYFFNPASVRVRIAEDRLGIGDCLRRHASILALSESANRKLMKELGSVRFFSL